VGIRFSLYSLLTLVKIVPHRSLKRNDSAPENQAEQPRTAIGSTLTRGARMRDGLP
jgi:hypothetical protein